MSFLLSETVKLRWFFPNHQNGMNWTGGNHADTSVVMVEFEYSFLAPHARFDCSYREGFGTEIVELGDFREIGESKGFRRHQGLRTKLSRVRLRTQAGHRHLEC